MLMRKLIYFISLIIAQVATAQVVENFGDGNYTNNPTWVGSTASFVVSNDSLRSNSTTVNDTFYLSTPSAQAQQAQWEFYIKLGLAPSSTNYVDVYLMSDVANLKQTQNGYFVRLGNTAKEISLYRVLGGIKTMIIDGANNALTSSTNRVKIKVTRDASDLWTIKREVNGTGSNFFTEQTVVDASVNTSAFFGFYVRQSVVSNHKKHWFDDIIIGNIILDTTPPTLLSSKVINTTSVDLFFDEPVDATTAQTITNYSANNSLGNPVTANVDGTDGSLVHLTFATAITTGINYTITVNNVSDVSLNVIAANASTTFLIAKIFDVVINEIMADPTPAVGLPDAEYIELYNKSSNTINLADWKLVVGTSVKILPAYVMQPNSYVVFVNATAAPLLSTYQNVVALTGLSSTTFTNSGTSLILKDNLDNFIHQVNYSDTWYLDALKKNGGWSLEQIDPNNPCGENLNWRASNNTIGGTPGTQNSINATNIDNQNPSLLSATMLNDSTLQLLFSESVIASNLNNINAYSVNNGIGNPTAVAVSGVLSNSVIIGFSSQFLINTIYSVSVSGVLTDCAGNIQSSVLTANFSNYTAKTFDIVINEIMADPDPSQGLPNVEYLEIYNRTTFPINLKNWKFKYGNTEKTIVSGVVPPNSFALITSPNNALALASLGNYNVMNTPDLSDAFLTNSGTTLLLQDSVGHDVCFVTYSDTWHENSTKLDGGWSLEKIDPNNLCAEKSNWKSAITETGGTPGASNSVSASNPDNSIPNIKNICVLDSATIQIDFSEIISTANITATNISINNGVAIQQVFVGNEYSNSITIKSTNHFVSDVKYTASIMTTVTDCNGNINSSNASADFALNAAALYQVVINEIMAAPTPVISALPEAEYVEIYNKSNLPISLLDYSFALGTSIQTIGCATINPSEYAIVCKSTDETLLSSYGKTIPLNSFSLTNDGQVLKLLNKQNDIISTVNYSSTWYGNSYKSNGGWSLEQVDPNNPCGADANWKASKAEMGGTPGTINSINAANADISKPQLIRASVVSANQLRLFFNETLSGASILDKTIYNVNNSIGQPQLAALTGLNSGDVVLTFSNSFVAKTIYTITVKSNITDCVGNVLTDSSTADFAIAENPEAGDILINEILYNPQTDGADFVEIYNNSDKVIDLKTLRMSIIDSTDLSLTSIYQIDSIGYLIFPKKYYVITKSSKDILGRYTVKNKKNFIEVGNLPSLSITAGSFAISKANLDLIDYTWYNDKMQFSLLTSSKGVSLERISFSRKSTDEGNWHSAAATVGNATPTSVNSQFSLESTSDDFITLSKDIFSPDNDGYDDILQISLKSQTQGNVTSINIYNQRGVFIKELANNLLLGTDNNVITWDGTNSNNEKTEIGIYVIVVSAFETNGNTKKYKKPIVVASKF